MTALATCTANSTSTSRPLGARRPEFTGDLGPRRAAQGVINDHARLDASRRASVVLIEDRILPRECLRSSLALHGAPWEVFACSSLEEWIDEADRHPPLAAVLLHVGSDKTTDPRMEERIEELIEASGSAPLIILGSSDDVVQILNTFELGARGYIPCSVSVEVCIEAINLAIAGGVYVPASTFMAMRDVINSSSPRDQHLTEMFTSRQIQVAKAIWEGKPNKIIAYELNMCESTVKVHARDIMRKLKATNRTEAAYKVSNLFAEIEISL